MTGTPRLTDSPVAAVYDTGIGGLATVQECLMAAPKTPLLFFVDRDMLPRAETGSDELRARVSAVGRFLRARGVEVVVPAAVWVWPHLDCFRDEGLAVIDPWKAVDPMIPDGDAVLGIVAPRPLADSGAFERWGSSRLVLSDSRGLAASVERQILRDQQLVDTVDRAVTDLRAAGSATILLLDSHANLVMDLFRRKLPRATFVAPQREFARLLSEFLGALPGPNLAPLIDLVVTGDYVEDVRAWANHLLAIPSPHVERVMQSPGNDASAPADIVALAYAAFDHGGAELTHYLASDAVLRPGDEPLLDSALHCRRLLDACETTIDELLVTGSFVGIVGTRRAHQDGHDSVVRFAHMIEVVDQKICSLSEEPTEPE